MSKSTSPLSSRSAENTTEVTRASRLLNLVAALKYTNSYLTADFIRYNVAGYGGDSLSKDSFLRKFERDKDYLRGLGIPIEKGDPLDGASDYGYKIIHSDYSIGELQLEQDEIAAIATAAILWKEPHQVHHIQRAIGKIRATGVDISEYKDSSTLLQHSSLIHSLVEYEQVFSSIMKAIDTGKRIRFSYRKAGYNNFSSRTIEPWSIIVQQRSWYVTGFDCDRQEQRQFKFSRCVGPITICDESIQHPHPESIASPRKKMNVSQENVEATVWIASGYGAGIIQSWKDQGSTLHSYEGQIDGQLGTYWVVSDFDEELHYKNIVSLGDKIVVISPLSLREKIIHSFTSVVKFNS